MADTEILGLVTDIVSAHVSNNSISTGDLPGLIKSVHDALAGLGQPEQPVEEPRRPAVPVRSAVKPDSIACLECGHRSKMLKRHLRVQHNLAPDAYRVRWGLPRDYPLVAGNYSERRRDLAKSIGLGRRAAKNATAPETATRKPARPKKGQIGQ